MATGKIHKVHLQKEQETLLMTLQAKALDSRLKRTILDDKMADEILAAIDYKFDKVNSFGNEIMVLRAKQLDVWLTDFLESHPHAIVLNLGCGLDTRVSRIGPYSRVSWFDVDYPDVIDLRRLFFASKEGYEMISSSVTEPGWLERIPSDRPVMVMAEGILEYLTENEVKTLLHRMTSHFPHGQVAFDVMNALAVNAGKERLRETTGAIHRWIVNDIHEVDKLNSNLQRMANISIFKSKYIHRLPLKIRMAYAAMGLIPSFKGMLRLLLYRF